MLRLIIVIMTCLMTSQAMATDKCYTWTGRAQMFVFGVAISDAAMLKKHKVEILKRAIIDWEAQASFYSPSFRWKYSKDKNLRHKIDHARHIIYGFAKATYCYKVLNRTPKRNQKCAPNDLKCKARNFKAIQKNKIFRPGIKHKLNPRINQSRGVN